MAAGRRRGDISTDFGAAYFKNACCSGDSQSRRAESASRFFTCEIEFEPQHICKNISRRAAASIGAIPLSGQTAATKFTRSINAFAESSKLFKIAGFSKIFSTRIRAAASFGNDKIAEFDELNARYALLALVEAHDNIGRKVPREHLAQIFRLNGRYH